MAAMVSETKWWPLNPWPDMRGLGTTIRTERQARLSQRMALWFQHRQADSDYRPSPSNYPATQPQWRCRMPSLGRRRVASRHQEKGGAANRIPLTHCIAPALSPTLHVHPQVRNAQRFPAIKIACSLPGVVQSTPHSHTTQPPVPHSARVRITQLPDWNEGVGTGHWISPTVLDYSQGFAAYAGMDPAGYP